MTSFMDEKQVSNQGWHGGIRCRAGKSRYNTSSQEAFKAMREVTPDVGRHKKKKSSQIYRSFTNHSRQRDPYYVSHTE